MQCWRRGLSDCIGDKNTIEENTRTHKNVMIILITKMVYGIEKG